MLVNAKLWKSYLLLSWPVCFFFRFFYFSNLCSTLIFALCLSVLNHRVFFNFLDTNPPEKAKFQHVSNQFLHWYCCDTNLGLDSDVLRERLREGSGCVFLNDYVFTPSHTLMDKLVNGVDGTVPSSALRLRWKFDCVYFSVYLNQILKETSIRKWNDW